MNREITLKQYCAEMSGLENLPASMRTLLAPFNIKDAPALEDEFLLVGHVIDAMASETFEHEVINLMTVMEMAIDLGLAE